MNIFNMPAKPTNLQSSKCQIAPQSSTASSIKIARGMMPPGYSMPGVFGMASMAGMGIGMSARMTGILGMPGMPGMGIPGMPGMTSMPGMGMQGMPGIPGMPGMGIPGMPGMTSMPGMGMQGMPGIPGMGIPGMPAIIPGMPIPNNSTSSFSNAGVNSNIGMGMPGLNQSMTGS